MNSHQIKLVNVKITKGQVDEAVAAGITHAKFKNKGVQKRLVKQQQKLRREQERREAHFKLVNKHKQAMIDQQRTVYTEAAQAEPVVQEGADALQALFGENQPQPADGVNAADLQSVTGLSELNPFDAPSGGHRQQMFADVDSHSVLAASR